MDHRHVRSPDGRARARRRPALGHRGDVLGLQDPGFTLEASQIARTDRLDRLVLVLALALYWAVSTGMWDAIENRTPSKKAAAAQRKNVARSLRSLFKRGLRRIRFCLQRLTAPPPLWAVWNMMGGQVARPRP